MNIEDLETLWNDEIKHFPDNFQGVMLAASGHVDSTALFHLFCHFSKRKKNFLRGLIHVNYKLRGQNSEDDQVFLCNLAKTAGIEFHGLESPLTSQNSSKKGLQEWARNVRHEYFQTFINKGFVVALAHQADDLAENVLMRLARGSEPDKLIGMKRLERGYWRPLLHLRRQDLMDYMARENITHRIDHSNQENKYTRNRIRNIVLPELEKAHAGSAQRIVGVAEDSAALSRYVKKTLHEQLLKNGNKLEVEKTKNLEFPVFKVLLSSIFDEMSLPFQQWQEGHIRQIFERLITESRIRAHLNDQHLLISDGIHWHIEKSENADRERNADPLSRSKEAVHNQLHIPPGGESSWQQSQKAWWNVTNLNTSKSLDIDIKTGKLRDKVPAMDCAKYWQLKDLYQRNREFLGNGAILYIIGSKNDSVHLFDGKSFLRPDHCGNLIKVNVDEFRINVRVETEQS